MGQRHEQWLVLEDHCARHTRRVAEATSAFSLALSQVGASRSGGCPTHLAASFVHEMLDSGSLRKHLKEKVLPAFRARYHAMLQAIHERLVPQGVTISTGKAYNYESGHANNTSNAPQRYAPQAGGYFIWLLLPSDLLGKGAELAAKGLEKYNLKFAHGGVMQVKGDSESEKRAAEGYGNDIRLSWAWHTEDEIVEGIGRLSLLMREALYEVKGGFLYLINILVQYLYLFLFL